LPRQQRLPRALAQPHGRKLLNLEAPRALRAARAYRVRQVEQVRQTRPAQTPASQGKPERLDKLVPKFRIRVTFQAGSSSARHRQLETILTSMIRSDAHFLWTRARCVS
jgi:hypothetical protein